MAAVALLGHSDTALAQTLSFSPAAVNLTISGSGATTSTAVFVSSTVNITGNLVIETVNTSDHTNWLCAQPTGGSSLQVSIGSGCAGFSSNQLQAGQTYTGQITVGGPTQSNGTVSGILQVTLQVGSSSTNTNLVAAMNPLSFNVQTNGSAPSQNDAITFNGGQVTVNSVSTSTSTGQAWLLASVGSSSVFVSVNVAGLSAGTYSGSVTANTNAGSLPIQVNLTVGGIPTLTVSPTSLNFAYQTGTSTPAAQTISLTSNGSAVNVSVNASTSSGGQGWLIVSPTGQLTTPSTITVTVNPAGLPAGTTYTGSIQINSFGGATNGSVTIPVNMLVSNSPIIAGNPSSLTFTAQAGGTAPSQNLTLTSSGTSLPYTASASVTSPSGGNWLNLPTQSGTTNGALIVSVNTAGLAAGTYSGSVNVSSPSAGNPNLSIPITLNITSGPVLQLNVPALSFAYEIGQGQPVNQTVTIASTSGQVSFTATAQSSGNWLSVSPSTGTAPGSIVVSASVAGLAANTYTGTITITPTSGSNTSALTLPVTLVVSSTSLLVVNPSSITFNSQAGSNSSLSPQTVAILSTDSSPITYTVTDTTNGLNWLLLNQTAGTTAANIQLSANPAGLSVGTYTGTVTIRASGNVANSPQTVAVTLNVTSSNTLSATPSSLSFSQATNGSAPQPQTINVTSSGASSGQQITFSAAVALTQQGQNWLTVSPTNGTTSSALTVSANGAGLAPGTYTGQIVLSSPGVNSSTVNVTLTVGSSSGGGLPSNGSFAHIASAGGWTTTFTLVNTGSSVAQVQLNFFDSFGNPLPLALSFPQSGVGVQPATTSASRTLNPGAQLIVSATGPANQVTQTGWAQLFTNGTIEGGAVFSQQSSNTPALFEAVVPLETRTPNSFLFAYDNTSGYDTGVAVANLSTQSGSITVVIQDDQGNTLQTNTLQVPAMGHTQFELDSFYGVTSQRRGTVQFVTPAGGQISILGFRFNPTTAFSTLPILTK